MRHITTEYFSLNAYAATVLFVFACLVSTATFAESNSGISDAELKNIKNEANDFVKALDKYTVKQKRQTMREVDKAILKLDNNIDRLEKRLEKGSNEMSEESRKEISQALRKIRKQRIEMAEWYGSMKSSSDIAWDEMKTGFTEAYQELHDAWVESEKAFSS